MTDDIKATRLSKAARDFNVGISTIVEFLHKKGFKLDPNPNEKLPPEAYALLIKEYSSDISVKKESEKLILKDLHRKKESVSIEDVPAESSSEENDGDEEILVKDILGIKKSVDIRPEIKKPDIKLVGKIDLEKTLKPKTEKAEPPKETKETKPVKEEVKKVTEEKKEKIAEDKQPKEEAEDKKKKSSIVIVGKIDLDAVTKETKPSKKEVPGPEAAEKTDDKKHISEKKHVEEPVAEEPVFEDIPGIDTILPEEEVVTLYKTDFKKLSGPTVVGKIDLPVEEKKKQSPHQPVKVGSADDDFRRKKKRKRITKDKEVFR